MRTGAGFMMLLLASPVAAQQVDSARLIACAGEPDDARRLACYDREVSSINAQAREIAERRARQTAELNARRAAEAKAAAETQARAAFGREQLAVDARGDRPAAETPRSLTARVQTVLVDPKTRNMVLLLDNGMMWRQTDGMPLPPLKEGTEVQIDRGMIGGYRLYIPSARRNATVVRMR